MDGASAEQHGLAESGAIAADNAKGLAPYQSFKLELLACGSQSFLAIYGISKWITFGLPSSGHNLMESCARECPGR